MRLADAPNAVKDEVNRGWFAELIEAQRRSLTAFDAQGAQEMVTELLILMVSLREREGLSHADARSERQRSPDNPREAGRPINRNYVSGAGGVTSLCQWRGACLTRTSIFDYWMTVRFVI